MNVSLIRAIAGGLCCGVLLLGAPAYGQMQSSYSVRHNYIFVTDGEAPMAGFNYELATRAFEWNPGWDDQSKVGAWAITDPGDSFFDSISAGFDRQAQGFLEAGATAQVDGAVLQWNDNVYSVTMSSSGSAHAQFWPNEAHATSKLISTIVAPWQWAAGQLVWQPVITDTIIGSASAFGVEFYDPVHVMVFAADGEVLVNDSFFDIFTELDFSLEWDQDGLRADTANNMFLTIDMPANPYTQTSGQLEFEIVDGVVTSSLTSGFFDTYDLPFVGADVSGGFDIPSFSNNFVFDYDFSWIPGGATIVFVLDGGGLCSAIPAPGALTIYACGCLLSLRRRRSMRR